VILAALLIFTDLISYSGASLMAASVPGIKHKLSTPQVRVRFALAEFLQELTLPYRGPVDGIVEYLKKEAGPKQTIKVPYEEHPLLFYTDLIVEPIRTLDDFSRETFPDWIILRKDWDPPGFWASRYFQLIQTRYQKILLDSPDIPWQNRPDPGYHRFRTDTEAPPVVAFRRIR